MESAACTGPASTRAPHTKWPAKAEAAFSASARSGNLMTRNPNRSSDDGSDAGRNSSTMPRTSSKAVNDATCLTKSCLSNPWRSRWLCMIVAVIVRSGWSPSSSSSSYWTTGFGGDFGGELPTSVNVAVVCFLSFGDDFGFGGPLWWALPCKASTARNAAAAVSKCRTWCAAAHFFSWIGSSISLTACSSPVSASCSSRSFFMHSLL
mmetsp:Transcript_6265/g.17656  ORF Transcript_6265/g.17656 Transcript_6265/m.17656 type:complete len:207 (-) Transcript_6265:133-753(-)